MTRSPIQAILSAAILPFSLAACGSPDSEDSFTESFNAEWHKSFVSSCADQATSMGVPQADALEKCTCAADYLDKNSDSLVEKANPPMEKMQAAMKECVG